MIAERLPTAYSVRITRAHSRRLRVVAYYTINRDDLIELRIRKHMTQEKLAKAAGVSKQTITRMETGTRTPQFDTIEKVAAALGTDSDSFVIYHTPENNEKLNQVQREWEERHGSVGKGGLNDVGDRGS